MINNLTKAYILAVDMGYGHQRAAYPLMDISATPIEWGINGPFIISANNYPGMPLSDRERWVKTQKTYEKISRLNSLPIIGKIIFSIMDYFQRIESFYPKRDLSRSTLQNQRTYKAISTGFGKHLIDVLNKNPLPLICTFFIPAILAEGYGYRGPIYCLCTDTDVSRAWAPVNSKESRIIYLAPTIRVKERLQLYGIRPDKIIVTGFPVPGEIIGNIKNQTVLLSSLGRRVSLLDPQGLYRNKYESLISSYLSLETNHKGVEKKPITITFAVGGAGAQWKIGLELLSSLRQHIIDRKININLIAGTSPVILNKFETAIKRLNLIDQLSLGVKIIYDKDKFDYFRKFNQVLIDTDLLWTKPSELSFYTSLGLPIIMSPVLGSQEKANRNWIQLLGAGTDQNDPRYAHEWLFDLIKSGSLAGMALNGFLKVPQDAVQQIKEVVFHNKLTDVKNISL